MAQSPELHDMPLYEYRCSNCGNQFEIQQSFTDDALTTCDVCEGALKKVFSPVGISFKGSGFYKNDSRGSSSSSSSGSSGTSSSSSSESGSTSTSSTPAKESASTTTSSSTSTSSD